MRAMKTNAEKRMSAVTSGDLWGLGGPDIGAQLGARHKSTRQRFDGCATVVRNLAPPFPFGDGWRFHAKCGCELALSARHGNCAIESFHSRNVGNTYLLVNRRCLPFPVSLGLGYAY